MKSSFVNVMSTLFAVALATAQQPQATLSQQPSTSQPLPQQPSAGQGPTLRLRCQTENGTVPYWLDSTCKSYLSCTNFNLTMETCREGRAYSYPQRSCLLVDQVNCSAQNEEFSTIIRSFLAPHFYHSLPRPQLPLVPFAADKDAAVHNHQTGPADGGMQNEEEEEEEEEMTIDLDDLPSILVDSSNAINITLPAETCQRLEASQVKQLQTSLNAALLILIGCPERSCDVALFHIDC